MTPPPPPAVTRDQIRDALNRWDPIDILAAADDPPQDEYDTLIDPVLTLLPRPHARQQLITMLERQMHDTYGLDPNLLGIAGFVDQLLTLPSPN